MKTLFIFTLLLLLISSCKSDTPESTEVIEPAVFLTLSPKMSEEDFSEQINKLNDENQLNNSRFLIQIENETIPFDINIKDKHIQLDYEIKFPKLSNQEAIKKINKFLKIKDSIFKIFENKYLEQKSMVGMKYLNNELNNKKFQYTIWSNLKNKDFLNNKKYRVFQDSIKTVLIGYSVIRLIDKYNTDEVSDTQNSKKSDLINKNPFSDAVKFINIKDEYPPQSNSEYNSPDLELNISINYFLNYDFKNLREEMINDSVKSLNTEIIKEEYLNKRNNQIKNNTNEF